MKNKIIGLLLMVATMLSANEYEDISKKFLEYKNINKTIISSEILKIEDKEVAYLFNLSGKGYILVPISKMASPIKGYSFDGNFDTLPPAYKKLLLNQLYDISSSKTLARAIDSKIANRWSFLENYTRSTKRVLYSYIANTNLLTTSWDQDFPYNKYFPKVGDETTLAGCVQVAMGQVMKYHNYPSKASGVIVNNIKIQNSSNVNVRTDTLKAVLSRYYNWEIMPVDNLSGKEYQNDELAYLMRDLAIVNNALIGVYVTNANVNIQALVENYGYSNTIARMETNETNIAEFISVLKEQIDSEQPVLFSLFETTSNAGHMAVADGYQDDSSGNYIHLNMGWGGNNNDYYNLDLDIGVGNNNFDHTDLDIIYNIKPCIEGVDCYINLESGDSIDNLNINGSLSTLQDKDKYELFLKGDTTIPYGGGYFIELYDSNNTLIQSEYEDNIVQDLPMGKYILTMTLESHSGAYFDTLMDYSLTINSQILSESEKLIVLNNLNTFPIIDQNISSKVITSQEKVLINGYDENSEDNLTFTASSNDNLNVSFDKNILTLTPNVTKGHSKVTVTVSSNNDIVEQEFDVLINDEEIYYGKEFKVNGTFADALDYDKHKVVLDGACTVSGNNGYSNQPFYTSLMEMNENYLNPMYNGSFTSSDLDLDFYLLGASLDSQYISYYPYEADHADYVLSVSCPNYDENITNLANLLGITIDNTVADIEPTPVVPTLSTLNLKQTWNLVSSDITLEQLNTNTPIVWQYIDNNWKVYAPTFDTGSYQTISSISTDQGTWILSNIDQNISVGVNDTNLTYTYDSGWSLNGTNKDINTTNISCGNANLTSVWKYTNNSWKLYTPSDLYTSYEEFDLINKNDGFWVKCN